MPPTKMRSTPPATATRVCPPWCDADHADPDAINHTRLTGAVLRDLHLTSVAVEIELARSGSRPPRIVVSIFSRAPLRAIFADLAIEEARRVHGALGEALRLADETVR